MERGGEMRREERTRDERGDERRRDERREEERLTLAVGLICVISTVVGSITDPGGVDTQ
jgi:hypothetical protein